MSTTSFGQPAIETLEGHLTTEPVARRPRLSRSMSISSSASSWMISQRGCPGRPATSRWRSASPFASIPAAQAKRRKDFWGFDLKKAPINARVWYPDGPGPFPLALIA